MTETLEIEKSATMRRVLVSGATGMIGSALIQSWASDQIDPIRLVRRQSADRSAETRGKSIVWDPTATQPFSDMRELSGVEAAVHLSGANVAAGRWTKKYKREIVSSRVQSTLALAKALAQLDPLPQVLVCASAIGIYGDRGEELLTEESSPGKGFLAETCVAWEAATQAASDAGIRVVHARFGVVLSPKGGALAKLLPLFRLGLGGNLGDGHAWMPWLTLRDAVGILKFGIDNQGISGPVNAVAPNAVRNAEFTKALGSAVYRPTILPAPAFALRLAFGEMADQALLASARVEPSRLTQSGYRFADPEIGQALQNLAGGS
jgi:uncharacterized protein (TIGR01777 family)